VDNTQSVGTWTPTLRGQTTAGAHTYSTQAGHYITVGDMVTAFFTIIMTAKDAAMAGNIQIAGLPFALNAGVVPSSAFVITRFAGLTLAAGRTQVGALGNVGATTALLVCSGSGVTAAAFAPADVSATVELYGSVTYRK
jgi:hypothetical protein